MRWDKIEPAVARFKSDSQAGAVSIGWDPKDSDSFLQILDPPAQPQCRLSAASPL